MRGKRLRSSEVLRHNCGVHVESAEGCLSLERRQDLPRDTGRAGMTRMYVRAASALPACDEYCSYVCIHLTC